MLVRLQRWFADGLWRSELSSLPPLRAAVVAVQRIACHAAIRFVANGGPVRAAALSLTTLLALVPILAIAIGIADLFGYRELFEDAVVRETTQWPEGLRSAVASIRGIVGNTSFKALGAVGTLLVALSAFRLFQDAEAAFCAIHESPRRGWWRRIATFAGVVLVLPPLAIAALLLKSMLQNPQFLGGLWPWLQSGYRLGLWVVPHGLCWIAFTLLYRWLPTARVPLFAAAVAGIAAGSTWLMMFGLYLRFQVGVALNNAIYGTLAALPLLIVYLQLAWTVLLFGGELSRAVQRCRHLRAGGSIGMADSTAVADGTQSSP